MSSIALFFFFFFFNDTATTEIYTLSLHDALPISPVRCRGASRSSRLTRWATTTPTASSRSEEHTSELQSRLHLVCRLLLEKKKKNCTLVVPMSICDVTQCSVYSETRSSRHVIVPV